MMNLMPYAQELYQSAGGKGDLAQIDMGMKAGIGRCVLEN